MDRTEFVTQSYEHMNAGDVETSSERFHPEALFHAPGLGVEVTGRDQIKETISRFIADVDPHYEVRHVVDEGPFTVAFCHVTATVDGQRVSWELCQVLRFDADDQVVEAWSLRGGEAVPAG